MIIVPVRLFIFNFESIMKKLFIKPGIYAVVIFILLEGLVRVFHLYSDSPKRMIDEYGVEKNIPWQMGVNVTGNRKQNVANFRINKHGFNSFSSKNGSKETFDIALIGDSFIEGFHQDNRNSLGRMIERRLDTVLVLEFGCSGYDMADQLHLVKAYKKQFLNIDKVVFYLKYDNDLERPTYEPAYQRLEELNATYYKIKNSSKLLVYLANLGLLSEFTAYVKEKINNVVGNNNSSISSYDVKSQKTLDQERIFNFKSLINHYGFDKEKYLLLLDTRKISHRFIDFCSDNEIEYIDLAHSFENAKSETTLIYDMHWNTFGRELVAKTIADYMLEQ